MAAINAAIENGPLTISVSESGYGSSWDLHIDAFGRGTWRNNFPTQNTRRFVVSRAQVDEFRTVLKREYFFDLADSYGEPILDTSGFTIQIWAGDLTKSVTLHHLADASGKELREPSRALRVMQVILAWCNDPVMTRFRKSNQRLIDAAK